MARDVPDGYEYGDEPCGPERMSEEGRRALRQLYGGMFLGLLIVFVGTQF
jgi:hypothetical protein